MSSSPTHLAVVTLGHGGGVPDGKSGNTNFALVCVTKEEFGALSWGDVLSPEMKAVELLKRPFWLVDCGPETTSWLCRHDLTKYLQGIFLTHTHTDHSGGVEAIGWRTCFVDHTKVALFFHVELRHLLEDQLRVMEYHNPALMCDGHYRTINDYFTLQPSGALLGEEIELALSPGCSVRYFFSPVDHQMSRQGEPLPAFALKFYVPNERIEDQRLVFSGDTAQVIGFVKFNSYDYLYHDCQFYNPGDGQEVHCPYSKLRDAIPPARRKHVFLAHTNQMPPQEAFDDGFQWAHQWHTMLIPL